ncbi:MAG TPA: DUF2812 domain-containing protein, partial [Clostridiales bacterium]|nr:DUF2812 domain-containing protein [Clostridiales bacterium]
WFWVWDFEEEEDWLNEMALQGWALDSVGFATFRFVSCEPGSYTIRLEMHGHDSDYLGFLEETGVEYLGRVFAWVYFRKKTEAGTFDIFSDIDSKIRHLDRICKMLFVIGMANIGIGLIHPSSAGRINLLCGALLMYALGRIHGKKEALKRERALRE